MLIYIYTHTYICKSVGVLRYCVDDHARVSVQCAQQGIFLYCRVVQCIAVYCNMLQCVTMYCSVLCGSSCVQKQRHTDIYTNTLSTTPLPLPSIFFLYFDSVSGAQG